MRMEISLQARLEQKLRLAPQIIQSIEILQLPALELQDMVKEALEENPTLEEDQGTDTPQEEEQPETDLERELEGLERIDAVWNEYFSRAGGRRNAGGEDKKWEAMQNTAAPSITLQEYLTQQLHLLDLDSIIEKDGDFVALMRLWIGTTDNEEIVSRVRELAEYSIFNIDGNGYLPYSLEDILKSYAHQEGAEVAEPADEGDSPNGHPDGTEAETAEPENVHDRLGIGVAQAAPPPEGAPLAPAGGDNGAPGDGDGSGPASAKPGKRPYVIQEAEKALEIVQTLEPPGVGGRNLKEVLLLQLGANTDVYEFERRLIENHLPDIQSNRLPKIAKVTGSDLDQVKEAVAFIRMLNPRPGALMAQKKAQYIIPDVVVEEVAGQYEVRLEDTYIPRLHISPQYRTILAQERNNPKVREYIKKKLESAKWLIESIEQRQNTLLKISREIVDVQRAFLDYGLEHLRPLKMQHIADRVGVHVSTVSRALSEKYVQTPRGIYAMKFFFTGGTVSQDGTMESTVSVKQKVRDIVDKEDKSRPLSDEEIARILKDDQGLDIARRTITKYRKQLGIPSSRQRRLY